MCYADDRNSEKPVVSWKDIWVFINKEEGEGNIYYCYYEGWNFNSGNYLFTTDTK